MQQQQNDIIFMIINDGEEVPVHTYKGEYRDLRALINDRCYVEDFGQCGGLGRCGTCLVDIHEGSAHLQELTRNEATTLNKAGMNYLGARLSCQIPINDELSNTVIHILDNSY
jgi:2Fe-2S ferredoxin